MENLTNEEKDYYELLVDLLENGEISDSERNILNKRKEKYSISDSRASEIEEFAREERLQNLKPQNDSETSYYELILDFMENGNVSENNRKILTKRIEKYGITEARAKELEYFAKQEYLESKKVKFESEEEKEYYEFIVDLMENGAISENSRKILDKRKIKFGISETRAKELEEFAKQNNSASSNDLIEEGKTYYNNGEYDKAIEIFKKAVELYPNDDDNYYWLGRSYYQNEQYEEAINSLLKAIQLVPNSPEYWAMLGISYGINGQIEEAIKSLLKAAELNPDDSSNWYNLGYAYINNEQYQESIEPLLKATELNPDDRESWCFLGNSYLALKDNNNAVYSFERAIEINPNYSDAWNNYGVALQRLNRIDEAISAYSKALEIDPNNETAKNNLQILQSSNKGWETSLNGIVSGISSTIDAVNEVYKKVDPEVVKGVVDIVKYFLKWDKEYLKGLYRK